MNYKRLKPKMIVICGPTGSGKTAVAISLAAEFNGEIIGADSMQIYRHLDIGTAKPTAAEQARIRHYLIDAVEPDAPFDAARFKAMATDRIQRLQARGVLPFVVGGTGLYIKALIHGLSDARPGNPEVRKRLNAEAAQHGPVSLYRRLKDCDAAAADRIHPNDTYRIVRALEVYDVTGRPISAYHRSHEFRDQAFRVLKIGMEMSRETLYERINGRVDRMIASGLLEEVDSLLRRGYGPELKSMQSIGYRHMVDFLQGRLAWEEALRTLKRDTRRYAKRQLTWFKRDPDINWIHPDRTEKMGRLIGAFLDSGDTPP